MIGPGWIISLNMMGNYTYVYISIYIYIYNFIILINKKIDFWH